MKHINNHSETENLLISDTYFKPGHYLLKIFQTIIAFIGWIAIVLPFIWILLPFIFPTLARKDHFLVYKEEVATFKFLFVLLSILFLSILLMDIALTLWNNYRFKYHLQVRAQYDEKRVHIRRELLKREYDQRFGPDKFRKEVQYYSVKEEQNLENDFIKKLYRKGRVDL